MTHILLSGIPRCGSPREVQAVGLSIQGLTMKDANSEETASADWLSLELFRALEISICKHDRAQTSKETRKL